MTARSWATSFVLLGLITVTGCGEMITYSKDSRKKGLEYLETNQIAEAQGAFRDAVRQNPRDYKSYSYLAKIYEQEQSYIMAWSHYKTSLNVQNVTDEGKADIAFRYETIDAFAHCLAKFDLRDTEVNSLDAAAASSKTGDEYVVLARTFFYRNDADSAIASYAKAAQQSPTSFYIAKENGLYLERLGIARSARDELTRAYRLYSDDVDVNLALRRLGVVPGPALKDESGLVKPFIPTGPIPQINWPWQSAPAPAPIPQETAPKGTRGNPVD